MTGMRPERALHGEQLAPRGTGGGLPILIEEGQRALSIRVDESSGGGLRGARDPGGRPVDHEQPGGRQRSPDQGDPAEHPDAGAGQTTQIDVEGKPQQVPG